MPDYGNDLIFGSFITPTNAAPRQVVALAQASEQAGLDLVTFSKIIPTRRASSTPGRC